MFLLGLTLTTFNIKEINTYKSEPLNLFIVEDIDNSIDSFKPQSIIKQICQQL